MHSDPLIITIYSFGYHLSGIPRDNGEHGGGFVFDCRGLPNPGREARYKDKTGMDASVVRYLKKFPIVHDFLEHAFRLVELTAENYRSRGFTSLTVAFGCTGGRHRSVFCAETIAKKLKKMKFNVKVIHKDIANVL